MEQVRAIDVNRCHREGRRVLLLGWSDADGSRALVNVQVRPEEVFLQYRVREVGGEWQDVRSLSWARACALPAASAREHFQLAL